MDWRATTAGLLVGIVVGATGMGGGSIMTPLLILGLGIAPVRAVASAMAFTTVTTFVGAWDHVRLRTVRFRTVAMLGAGSIPASVLGAIVLTRAGSLEPVIEGALKLALGAAFVALAVLLAAGTRVRRLPGPPARGAWARWRVVTGAAVIGAAVGLTSVGSGSLTTGLLALMRREDTEPLVGTVIFHSMVLTGAAGLAHLALGGVGAALTLSLLTGSLPGVLIGSRMTLRISAPRLRAVQACMLCALGVLLSLSAR